MNLSIELIRKVSLFVLQKFTYKISDNRSEINIHGLCSQFDKICFYNSNKNKNKKNHNRFSKLIAIGTVNEIKTESKRNALHELQSFVSLKNDWLFGFLTYDLKNEIENLDSKNSDSLHFPLLQFFVPKVVIQVEQNSAIVFYNDDFTKKEEAKYVVELTFSKEIEHIQSIYAPEIKSKISKEEYLKSVSEIQQHIHRGEIYEMNFCTEFYTENTIINPCDLFEQLNSISEAPFSAFCKFDDHYLISSSPERFLQKTGNTLISQPIKGTKKRSVDDAEDEALKNSLAQDSKEKNENVMIVDLVRNDLSKIAKQGSVTVDELFGVYTFKQVHQMISTISCELKNGITLEEILRSTFPMGSMTGAPKVSAMKIIERYETTKRGLYSGAIGYITPEGDFDFSVVIRSILYNSLNHYLSFMVGSAITAKANPEAEYNECLLKAKAIFEVLQKSTSTTSE